MDNPKVTLETGFFLKGIINVLGFKVDSEIEVNLPTKISIKARFDKVSLAGGLIEIAHEKEKDAGPEFELVLGATEVTHSID